MKRSISEYASHVLGGVAQSEADYPLCDALEGIPGATLISYTHGRLAKFQEPTFVFSSSPQIANLISRLLNRCAQTNELRFSWSLTARFADDGMLVFRVSLNDKRAHWVPFFLLFGLYALRQDLARMAQLLRTERALYLCENKEVLFAGQVD